jgi:hypothetical protein
MRTITSNPKQQRHIEILTRLEAGVLEVGTAAELLGVGARQVRRLRVMLGWQAVRLPSSRLSRFVHCPIRRSRGILTMSGDPGPSLTPAHDTRSPVMRAARVSPRTASPRIQAPSAPRLNGLGSTVLLQFWVGGLKRYREQRGGSGQTQEHHPGEGLEGGLPVAWMGQ